MRLAGLVLWRATVLAAWIWGLPVVFFYDPWPLWLRLVVMGLWLTLWIPCRVWLLPWYRRALGVLAFVLVVALWCARTPSNNRTWEPGFGRMPLTHIVNNQVTVQNLRHRTFDGTGHPHAGWYRQTFDLDDIATLEFGVQPFSAWRGLAHTFVTFGFGNGDHLCISVESRKEDGEAFSPLRGLFRQFEIMYVVGDERDVIGGRAVVRKFPVYLYPVKAPKEKIRELLVAMLSRANKLAHSPEFYNTLTHNCTTAIVRHMEQLRGEKQAFDLRIVFPGYADEVAYGLGLIEADIRRDAVRETFRLPDDVSLDMDARSWSRAMRTPRTLAD